MKNFSIVLTALAALTRSNAAALAHAMLDNAVPAVGSTVASAPKEVVLNFTSNLEPKFSSIEVKSASGGIMQAGKASAKGSQMRVGLKALPPGTYTVNWRVLSVDTHRTQGNFTFRVGQ
jgi:methionine-rich copper-binding protein CopC